MGAERAESIGHAGSCSALGGDTVSATAFPEPGIHSEKTAGRDFDRRAGTHERRLRRAQQQLLARVDRPFRLSELAEVTHCSERTLQVAFMQAYGVGPMEWFRVIRLKAVHRELRDGGSRDTRITEVAMRWGFSHLGRFSAEYRKLFGEKPIETLERSRTATRRSDAPSSAVSSSSYAVPIG
jgi:transcriptional regulator GlxA family with amidase domain